jgi:acyl carrier protein
MPDIETTIRSLLSHNAEAQGLGDDDDLLEAGLLDSVGVLSLLAGLEKSFRLKIDTKHLTKENFRSFRAIADLVRRLTDETEA